MKELNVHELKKKFMLTKPLEWGIYCTDIKDMYILVHELTAHFNNLINVNYNMCHHSVITPIFHNRGMPGFKDMERDVYLEIKLPGINLSVLLWNKEIVMPVDLSTEEIKTKHISLDDSLNYLRGQRGEPHPDLGISIHNNVFCPQARRGIIRPRLPKYEPMSTIDVSY